MANGFKPTSGEIEFGNFLKEKFSQPLNEPTEKGFISGIKEFLEPLDPAESVFRAGVRGVVKGVSGVGKAFGPLPPRTQEEAEEEKRFPERLRELIPPIPAKTGERQGAQQFTEDIAERGGEILPLLLGGEAGIPEALARSAGAGVLGETAKKLGFGPLVQAAAEIPAFIAPRISRILTPAAEQREFVEFLRQQGLTEEQITPLLQEGRKGESLFSKFANRGKRAQEAVELARQGRNTAFSNLKSLPEAQTVLPESTVSNLFNDFQNLFREIPVETAKLLENDMDKFLASGKTQGDLAILWDAINFQFTKRGGKRLQPLKQSITQALESTSPEFARLFELTNDVGRRFQNIQRRLTPTEGSKLAEIIQFAKAPVQLAVGISFGNFPLIAEVVGEFAARELGREMLINPRFQNLGQKMMTATKNSNLALAKSTWNQITRELRNSGVDQETIDKLQDVDTEDFIDTVGLGVPNKKALKKNAG